MKGRVSSRSPPDSGITSARRSCGTRRTAIFDFDGDILDGDLLVVEG